MGYKKGSKLRSGPEWDALDAVAMSGDDAWKTVDGVAFTHWDRWMLRLAIDEPTGLVAIEQAFDKQIVLSRIGPADQMRAYAEDLHTRIASLSLRANDVLGLQECASLWLKKRATDRVWSGTSNTPLRSRQLVTRRVLQAPWTRPDWPPFEVSPAPHAQLLGRHFAHGEYYDWRGVGLVTELFDRDVCDLLAEANGDVERLAVLRATLGVLLQAIDQVDDSGAHVGMLFDEYGAAYLECLQAHLSRPGLLADVLELIVWDGCGLFGDTSPFLRSLPADAKALGRAALRVMAEELARSGLYQRGVALGLMEELAGELRESSRQ